MSYMCIIYHNELKIYSLFLTAVYSQLVTTVGRQPTVVTKNYTELVSTAL